VCFVVALGARAEVVSAANTQPTYDLFASQEVAPSPNRNGEFELLTYNVAGVPDMLSRSRPATNTGQVSPLLDAYDLVLAQEDFMYHADLTGSATHPYQKAPTSPRSAVLGDGLAMLSKKPLGFEFRVRWRACHGYLMALSDCFAENGFAATELGLSTGVRVAVLNLHADAGRAEGDVQARRDGFTQLADFINHSLSARAVIVAGDTNLDDFDARDVVTRESFLASTGLREVCREFDCRGQNLDRVFYRSSKWLSLVPTAWRADPRFVDAHGEHLSDHPPMAARFSWHATRAEP
jgi:hypothetical protein